MYYTFLKLCVVSWIDLLVILVIIYYCYSQRKNHWCLKNINIFDQLFKCIFLQYCDSLFFFFVRYIDSWLLFCIVPHVVIDLTTIAISFKSEKKLSYYRERAMTIGREGKKKSEEIIPKRVRKGAIKKGPILLSQSSIYFTRS